MPARSSGPGPSDASLSFRHDANDEVETVDWNHAPSELPATLAPWRTFHWRYGQRHYSGSYWSATQRDHVIYESRLELTRLIYADFDPNVRRVAAQPFLIQATIGGKPRRHVPDFLFTTPEGPIVVDVKPAARLTNPETAFTLEWTRHLVEQRGWRYEIWTEPPPTELANIRFLAGYRDARRFNQELVGKLMETSLHGSVLEQAFHSQPQWPVPIVKSAVLHLIWRGDLSTDLYDRLNPKSVLRQRSGNE